MIERRQFVKAAAATSLAASAGSASGKTGPLPRRPYRAGVELSIIGFGGIVVVGQEQAAADRVVAESIERGVNYFDVAPSYFNGEAETKLGIALKPYRRRVFLACKTQKRDGEGARLELEQSLRRLRTDHVDLYQFHAVGSMADVEKILAPGGAAEFFVQARKEGKTHFLGFSAHSAEAAIALMDRMTLDSVLFPVNFACYAEGNFGPQILEHAKKKGLARMALKAMAHSRWPAGTNGKSAGWPKCWYKPVDERDLARQALRFTLSEDLTAAIPPGDERLYAWALDFASGFTPLSRKERAKLLAMAKGLEPVFRA